MNISHYAKISYLTLKHISFLRNGVYFCTKPAYEETFSHFRTNENSPLHHTSNHIGRYYTLPEEYRGKLFFSGGITRRLDVQMKTFQEIAIMVREPALEVMSYLKRINFSNPAVRFILYGRNGSGKSCSLMHILHYAYESKFLLVHMPWVSNWTKHPKEVVASHYKEGRFDLPVESAIWLQHFQLQNSHLLEELDLRTSKSYTWSKREVTEEGSPLTDIIQHGLQRVIHSSDCVAALLKEIKHHSQFGKYKTMVMVDGVNAFWNKTNVKRPDKSLVPPEQITICHALMKLLQNDWNNAVIVTSVDILPYNRDFSMHDPYTPRVLLGKEGFELLDPFIPIEVKEYTEKEIDSVLDYYCDRLWIQSERGRTDEGRRQIKFLSGYNPGEVRMICDPL